MKPKEKIEILETEREAFDNQASNRLSSMLQE
jgi:hypothetical protein